MLEKFSYEWGTVKSEVENSEKFTTLKNLRMTYAIQYPEKFTNL